MKVLEETEQPDPSAHGLEKIISSDQAIVSKVLRVVNSAYYGLPGQVTSVGQALVILGMQQVRNLVLSVGAVSTMPIRTQRQRDTLRVFWVHSFGTAAATQIIAKQKMMPTKDSETMFVGGLLHDVGRLFLFTHFTQVYDQVIDQAVNHNVSVEQLELEVLGVTHSEIGAAMAEKWKLPEPLVKIIREHEGPFEDNHEPTVLAVHVGDAITKHLYWERDKLPPPSLHPNALTWLGFDLEDYEMLRDETAEKVEQATAMFGMLAA